MKSHLTVFALTAILIVSIGMAPAFGQLTNESIVVTTDKASYSAGEVIVISGEVRDLYSGTPVGLIVKNDMAIVAINQLTVGADKKFSTEITAGGTMNVEGTYTVQVTYGTANRTAETTFEFGGVPVETETPPDESRVSDTMVKMGEGNASIGYEITGGSIISIEPDVDPITGEVVSPTLLITIDATNDGSLTLVIPRSVLDSAVEGEDDEFFVLIDGEEVEFTEDATSTSSRTITIEFAAGDTLIEIIGTFVVPEFGTIAAMILAVAIISIIAVSSKSRLSIMPRY